MRAVGKSVMDCFEIQEGKTVVVWSSIGIDAGYIPTGFFAPKKLPAMLSNRIGDRAQTCGVLLLPRRLDVPSAVASDRVFKIRKPEKSIIKIQRGEKILVTEREQVPVVVANTSPVIPSGRVRSRTMRVFSRMSL